MEDRTMTEPIAKKSSKDVHLSTRAFLGLLCLLVLPWMMIALGRLPNPLREMAERTKHGTDQPGSATEVREGPWGILEINDLAISPVDILVPGQLGVPLPINWFFDDFSVPRLQELLTALDLTELQRADLLATNTWEIAPSGITLHPSGETILGLAPDIRTRLYEVLGASAENQDYFQPWSMKAQLFERRLALSKLNTDVQDLIRHLAYRRGSRVFISDVPVILNRLGDMEQKRRVMRLLNSASTYQVTLVVPPGADTDAIAGYWGGGNRRKDIKPILESLSQLPGGGKLDIAHLLPAFARQRLYIYPSRVLAQDGVRRDCHWTSLNFFSLVAEDRFGNSDEATRHILENYYQTGEAPQYGDLVLFMLPSGDSIHSAVVLAGNMAFTKNGENLDQPWIIMDIGEIQELYSQYFHTELGVQYWRRK